MLGYRYDVKVGGESFGSGNNLFNPSQEVTLGAAAAGPYSGIRMVTLSVTVNYMHIADQGLGPGSYANSAFTFSCEMPVRY